MREADVEMRRIGRALRTRGGAPWRIRRRREHPHPQDRRRLRAAHAVADRPAQPASQHGNRQGAAARGWSRPDAREALSHVEFRKSTQKTLSSAEAVLSIPAARSRARLRRRQRGAGRRFAVYRGAGVRPLWPRDRRPVDFFSDHALRRRYEVALRRAVARVGPCEASTRVSAIAKRPRGCARAAAEPG